MVSRFKKTLIPNLKILIFFDGSSVIEFNYLIFLILVFVLVPIFYRCDVF